MAGETPCDHEARRPHFSRVGILVAVQPLCELVALQELLKLFNKGALSLRYFFFCYIWAEPFSPINFQEFLKFPRSGRPFH